MPTLPRADAVIGDPPYGIGYKSGPISRNSISTTRKRFSQTIHGDDTPFDPAFALDLAEIVVLTGAQHYYHKLPPGGSFHVWNKRGPYIPLDQADGDLVWINRRMALRVVEMVWRGLCRTVEHNEPILHPTQKPRALMEWCIAQARVPPGGTILDPWMGSGTTLIAAIRRGHPCVGIEIDSAHYETALRRVEAATRQADLFVSAPSPAPDLDAAYQRPADLFSGGA